MPFVYNDELYITYSLVPHKVYRLRADGIAELRCVTPTGMTNAVLILLSPACWHVIAVAIGGGGEHVQCMCQAHNL